MEPPDGSSTVVSFWRWRKPGMDPQAPVVGVATLGSGSTTCVETCSEILPPDRTVGVKFRLTPYCCWM